MSLLLLPLLLPSSATTPPGEVAEPAVARPVPSGMRRTRTAANHLSLADCSATKGEKVVCLTQALGTTTALQEGPASSGATWTQ